MNPNQIRLVVDWQYSRERNGMWDYRKLAGRAGTGVGHFPTTPFHNHYRKTSSFALSSTAPPWRQNVKVEEAL